MKKKILLMAFALAFAKNLFAGVKARNFTGYPVSLKVKYEYGGPKESDPVIINPGQEAVIETPSPGVAAIIYGYYVNILMDGEWKVGNYMDTHVGGHRLITLSLGSTGTGYTVNISDQIN